MFVYLFIYECKINAIYCFAVVIIVDNWWRELFPLVKERLWSSGSGSVIMVQMENEYGSYGDCLDNPQVCVCVCMCMCMCESVPVCKSEFEYVCLCVCYML